MQTTDMVFMALLALTLFWAVGAYNRLVRMKKVIADGFSGIDSQFKDRHDLLLKLVEAASSYLQHDPLTLPALLQARSTVSTAHDGLRAQPGSAALTYKLLVAEGQLQAQLDVLWRTAGDTLAMQADPKFRELAEQLNTAQRKLGFSCQAFNASVVDFNAARAQFPTVLIARLFDFSRSERLQLGVDAG
jgi:LemA protein